MTPFARITIAVIAFTVAAGAQQKPNFAGRWVVVSPKEGAGQEQIVTQTDKTLTTEYPSKTGGRKTVYQLDGVERRMAGSSPSAEITILTKAYWADRRIVIAIDTSYPGGMRTQSKDVWSIDAQGRLVIDSTEMGPGGTPGPVTKVIYVKNK